MIGKKNGNRVSREESRIVLDYRRHCQRFFKSNRDFVIHCTAAVQTQLRDLRYYQLRLLDCLLFIR